MNQTAKTLRAKFRAHEVCRRAFVAQGRFDLAEQELRLADRAIAAALRAEREVK